MKSVYLDHCSTTPLCLPSIKAIHDYCEIFGNPSAQHHYVGSKAYEYLEAARAKVAEIFQVEYQGVVFTSSATEANNIVLQGFARKHKERKPLIIINPIEHKSILEVGKYLQKHEGVELIQTPIDKNGQLNLSFLRETLLLHKHRPILVCVMHTNNEIPVKFPIKIIGELCHAVGAYFHCDAVQGVVREALNMNDLLISSLTLSAHKIYGPKGCGVLLLNKSEYQMPLFQLQFGGQQEFGLRPATENLLAIMAATTAFEYHETTRAELCQHMQLCQDSFVEVLTKHCDNFSFTVPINLEVPGIVSLWFKDCDAPTILEKIPHIGISRGSACSSNEKFSHVPQALGLPLEVAANVLRISFGWGAAVEDCKWAAQELVRARKTMT